MSLPRFWHASLSSVAIDWESHSRFSCHVMPCNDLTRGLQRPKKSCSMSRVRIQLPSAHIIIYFSIFHCYKLYYNIYIHICVCLSFSRSTYLGLRPSNVIINLSVPSMPTAKSPAPFSANARPTAYLSMSTLPRVHWEQATTMMPAWTLSINK